jgi:hypothetical protein
LLISNLVIVVPEFNRTDTFIFRMTASFGSPLKLSPSSPKRRKETLKWKQCIICQCSNAESVICMRDVGKDSFVRSVEIRSDEVYSRILQEMSTMDNFISCKIKVVYHRNCYRKYTSNQNCSVFKTDQINFYKY